MSVTPGSSAVAGGIFGEGIVQVLTGGLIRDSHLHPRSRLREYIWRRLIDSGVAADRVYAARIEPIQLQDARETLPAISIYTKDETSDVISPAPKTLERVVELHIQCIAAGEHSQDTVDEMAFIVERLIGFDIGGRTRTLGGNAAKVWLSNTSSDVTSSGALQVASADLTFTVIYHDEISTFVGEDLLGIGVDWDRTAADQQLEAEDAVDFLPED